MGDSCLHGCALRCSPLHPWWTSKSNCSPLSASENGGGSALLPRVPDTSSCSPPPQPPALTLESVCILKRKVAPPVGSTCPRNPGPSCCIYFSQYLLVVLEDGSSEQAASLYPGWEFQPKSLQHKAFSFKWFPDSASSPPCHHFIEHLFLSHSELLSAAGQPKPPGEAS